MPSPIQGRPASGVEGAMGTAAADAGSALPRTTWGRRALVRFGAFYVVLYALPFPLGFPGSERAAELLASIKRVPATWIARASGVALPTQVHNSGDSGVAWLEVVACFAIAAVLAGATLITTRRRPADQRWASMLATYLRYFVAAQMFAYGSVKVLKSQFPALEPSDLQTTYGESSPQGLLWRMMSLSTGYTVFTGVLEVVGALLLYFRRTTVLGALLLSVALVQVVALNLAFDVPVKLGSMHLLVFTLILLAPHARRLTLFLAGLTAPGRIDPPLFAPTGRRRWVLGAAKAALVAGTVGIIGHEAWIAYRTWGDGKPRAPLTALYQVSRMEVDGEPVADRPAVMGGAAPTSLPEGWYRVTIDRNGFVVFGTRGGRRGFAFDYDPARDLVVVTSGDDRLASIAGSTGPHPDAIALRGTLGGRPTTVELERVPEEKILLVGSKLRWVIDEGFYR